MQRATLVFCVCLFMSFCAVAQENVTAVKIDRSIGKIELGEYLTKSMVSESFGLSDIYDIQVNATSTTIIVNTRVERFGVVWDAIEVTRDNVDREAEGVLFSKKAEDDLSVDYYILRDFFSKKYGKTEENLSYGGTHLSSSWSDGETIVDLVHISYRDKSQDSKQCLYLSFGDLKNE